MKFVIFWTCTKAVKAALTEMKTHKNFVNGVYDTGLNNHSIQVK